MPFVPRSGTAEARRLSPVPLTEACVGDLKRSASTALGVGREHVPASLCTSWGLRLPSAGVTGTLRTCMVSGAEPGQGGPRSEVTAQDQEEVRLGSWVTRRPRHGVHQDCPPHPVGDWWGLGWGWSAGGREEWRPGCRGLWLRFMIHGSFSVANLAKYKNSRNLLGTGGDCTLLKYETSAPGLLAAPLSGGNGEKR